MLCFVGETPVQWLLIRQLLDAQGNYQQSEQFCSFLFQIFYQVLLPTRQKGNYSYNFLVAHDNDMADS